MVRAGCKALERWFFDIVIISSTTVLACFDGGFAQPADLDI